MLMLVTFVSDYSAHGGQQLSADIQHMHSWLRDNDGEHRLAPGVAGRLLDSRPFQQWARITELLLWQPGQPYSNDDKPPGVQEGANNVAVVANGRGRAAKKTRVRHRGRVAPSSDVIDGSPIMTTGQSTADLHEESSSALEQDQEKLWLKMRLRTPESKSSSCFSCLG